MGQSLSEWLAGGFLMSQPIVENYEEVVRRSGLVAKEKLDGVLSQLGRQSSDPQVLAQRLEDESILTPWQNSKLMRGCYRGFFLGRYKLLAHLGSGGMSSVYLGEHSLMRRRVAIKVLHQKLTESPSYLERFYRESRTMSTLDHPNIVRAFDIDCEGKHHYLVMEYIDGPTLRQLVEKDGPLDYMTVANYFSQAAEGLAHAHEVGLIHRDVKPANLMVNPKGVVKVVDLGMALTDSQGESLTLKYNESVLGTADYLSPEQALNSHNVDARADIYSLGCSMYYTLVGRAPFDEGSMAQRLMRHQSEPVAPITNVRPDAPAELVKICERMLAKMPKQRYQSAGDVAKALSDWIADQAPDAAARTLFPNRKEEGDDTVNDVAQFTVIGALPMVEFDDEGMSADGRTKVRCPSCKAALWAKLANDTVRAKCPRCGSLMGIPSAAAAHAANAMNLVRKQQAPQYAPQQSAPQQNAPQAPALPPPAPMSRALPPLAPAPKTSVPKPKPEALFTELAPEAKQPAKTPEVPPDAGSWGLKDPSKRFPGESGVSRRPATGITLTPNETRKPSSRPTEISDWTYDDFISAFEDGDLRLVEAVISLSVRFSGSERVAEVLARLLNSVTSPEAAAKTGGRPLDRRLLRALIAALGAVSGQQATAALCRMVLGVIPLGKNDRMAAEASLEALAANPTPEREDFLIDAIANADIARPRGRGDFTAEDLRAEIVRLFQKHMSSRARMSLRMKLSEPGLSREARAQIERVLRK